MSLNVITEQILIFDQEVGGFDILEAFRLAKLEYTEGWDTNFSVDGFSFSFYNMFGEDWATMRFSRGEGIMVALITPYSFDISPYSPEGDMGYYEN